MMAKDECAIHATEYREFKRFLCVVVGVLLSQTGALIWWCSSMHTKVQYVERDIASLVTIVADCCP